MSLRNKIENNFPENIGRDILVTNIEYHADKHAERFAYFLVSECKPHGKSYLYQSGLYSIGTLLQIYKNRYPDGYRL